MSRKNKRSDIEQYEDKEQEEMFDPIPDEDLIQKELNGEPEERQFDLELTLKLKRGRCYTIPLLAGKFNSSTIFELLNLAMRSRRNCSIIEAVLDNPEPTTKQRTNGKISAHDKDEFIDA